MKKQYPILGILASVFYISAVIAGGFLREGYSHIYNSISELTVSDKPVIPVIVILFTLYNLFSFLFGFMAFIYSEPSKRKSYRAACLMLSIMGLLGLIMYFFPQDPRNAVLSFSGLMHLIIAGIMSPLTIAAVIVTGIGLKGTPQLNKFRIYSYISAALILTTGGVTAYSTSSGSQLLGLFERFTIGTYIIWLFVFAFVLLRYKKKNKI